jgi:hypothetical protein
MRDDLWMVRLITDESCDTTAFLFGLMIRFINRFGEALLLCEVRITLKCIKNGAVIDKTRSA